MVMVIVMLVVVMFSLFLRLETMQKFLSNVIIFRFYHRYWFVGMIFVMKMFVAMVVMDM